MTSFSNFLLGLFDFHQKGSSASRIGAHVDLNRLAVRALKLVAHAHLGDIQARVVFHYAKIDGQGEALAGAEIDKQLEFGELAD